jgi:succinate dehydrogenase/fumarate reductase flavoprotein subunit
MSTPRRTERKIRQRRKATLGKLRAKYAAAKTENAKHTLIEKAIKVSPFLDKAEIQKSWK